MLFQIRSKLDHREGKVKAFSLICETCLSVYNLLIHARHDKRILWVCFHPSLVSSYRPSWWRRWRRTNRLDPRRHRFVYRYCPIQMYQGQRCHLRHCVRHLLAIVRWRVVGRCVGGIYDWSLPFHVVREWDWRDIGGQRVGELWQDWMSVIM